MMYDCNLKIYQTLNVQSEFNIGLLLLYIIEGSSNISINGKTNMYKSNDMIVINDLDHYRILSSKKSVIACLFLSRVELDKFFRFNKKYYINKDKLDLSVLKFYMNKLIVNYVNDQSENEKQNKILEYINQLVMTLHLYRKLDGTIISNNIDVYSGINYMYEHYKEKLYIGKVATQCLLSVRRFSNKLEEVTGMRFNELLRNIRLSYSAFDLMYTKKLISQIANDNGFTNESGFITHFRDKYHITPAKFRKQLENDHYYPFHNKNTTLLRSFEHINDQIKYLTDRDVDYVSIDINMKNKMRSKISTPNLLIYIRDIETLTNNFQQSKLLSMRREIGLFGLLFSHQLFYELYQSNFENNKLVHQMFSFSLEHQFDISFEVKLGKNQNIEEFTLIFKRLLNYLTDCTYFYGQRSFQFYIDASYYQFNRISKIIQDNLKESKVILVLNKQNNYLAKRMSHKVNDNKQIACKVHHEIDSDKDITSILKNNPSLNILYQPNIPNRIESLISIFKWSIAFNQNISMIIDDTWLDSMIPSQSSHLMIKELQLNKESHYQLFELILTLKRLRGDIVYFNGLILMTHYLNEYQIIIFPNMKIFNRLHQRININGFKLGEIEYRHHDILIKNNQLIINSDGDNHQNMAEVSFKREIGKLIVQFYTSPYAIKHIYIKQKIN